MELMLRCVNNLGRCSRKNHVAKPDSRMRIGHAHRDQPPRSSNVNTSPTTSQATERKLVCWPQIIAELALPDILPTRDTIHQEGFAFVSQLLLAAVTAQLFSYMIKKHDIGLPNYG